MRFHGFQGSNVGGLWQPVARESWPLKKKCCNPRSYSISLRVIMFGASRLGGLLNRFLSLPPIPFESGVDFSLNCSVCLVKVTVFNLCHLVSLEHPIPLQRGVNYQLCLSFKKLANGCRRASIRHLCVAIVSAS